MTRADKRRIEVAEDLGRTLRVDPDHDPVGLHEVVDRRALLEELGVRAHEDDFVGSLLDGVLNELGGADWYGALGDDDLLAVHGVADRSRNRQDVLQVGGAVFPRRCAHRDEDHLRLAYGHRYVRRELQPASLEIVRHHGLQPRLVDRNLATFQ